LEKSLQFYVQVLGMKETGRSKIDQNKGTTVSLTTHDGGPVLELNYYEKGSPFDVEYVAGEGMDHLAFQVDDYPFPNSELEPYLVQIPPDPRVPLYVLVNWC